MEFVRAMSKYFVPGAIIGTYQERGASTFWDCVNRLPLKENPIICWKFCHVLHKVRQLFGQVMSLPFPSRVTVISIQTHARSGSGRAFIYSSNGEIPIPT